MALKSTLSSEEKTAEIEEALDALDKLVDRLKVLYEQYFMGIQKQAPAHLHTDAERRIRDVAQMQIRNTALRYRFATIQQKFGSYNTYWKRTLREIESGRYLRNLSKLRRQAQRTGEALPEEILAAMPARMREAIERDRAVALADAKRRHMVEEPDTQPDQPRVPAPPPPGRRSKSVTTDPFKHAGDDDIAAALAGLADEALAALEGPAAAAPALAPRAPATPPVAAPSATPVPPRPPAVPRVGPPPLPPRPPASPPVAATAPPPPPVAAPRPAAARAAPGTGVPGMSDAETRALYAKYMKAREVVGDKTEGFTYDKLVRTLQSQAPKILEQHKAERVEFNVVIRDNKVILKAKPR